MAAFNFPNSPSTNDTHSENNVTWKWDGTMWNRVSDVGTTLTQLNVTGVSTFASAVNIGGVLTYEDVKNVDSVGIITAREGIFLPDSKKLQLGNAAGSADLEIFHDGSHSYIKDTGTGDLVLQGTNNVWLQHGNGENALKATQDAGVELRFNNIKKIETDADGIRIGSGGGDNTIVDLHNASYDNGVIQYYNGSINLKTGSSNGDRRISLETAGSQRLLIDSSGQVNIGAAAANTAIHASGLFNGATPKLEIKLGAAANSYTRLINITNPGAQTNSETLGRVGIKLSLGSEANSGESNKSGIIYAESTSGYNNAVSLCLATNNTEALRITSTGGCHIGNPSLTNSWDTHAIALSSNNSATFSSPATVVVAGGTAYNTANMAGGGIRFVGKYDSSSNYTTFAHVSGIKENTTDGNYNGALTFHTRTNGGAGAERLRITSAGNIGVGNASPSTKLSLEGSAGSTSHGILIGPKHSGGIRGVVEVHSAADTIGFNLSRTGGGSDTDIVLLRNVSSGGVIEARNSSNVSKVYLNSSGSSYLLEGLGVGVASPMNRFQCGSHTFSGSHGMYTDSRVGMSNHGELTGLMLASIYNDSNHPEYGVVFVQGPSTSSYNVWGICPDGPAKGNSLNLHYGAQNTNIHAPTNQKFEFTGEGYLRKPKHPSFLARRSTGGDGRGSASPITEWSTSTTAPCHNIGGHFNASNGKFTAPVAGIYHFSACPGYKQTNHEFNLKFRIDNTDVFEPVRFIDGGDDLTSHSTSTGSITVYMNANQTMSVCIAYTHHVNTTYNFFSGHLVG